MRDSSIIGGFQNIEQRLQQVVQFVEKLQQSVRLAFTGETVRSESLQSLLLKKGVITQEELTAEIGVTIQKMQEEAEKQAKAAQEGLVKPSVKQVQQVEATKVIEPKQDGYTPNLGGISVEEHNKLNEQVPSVHSVQALKENI